MSGRSWLGGCYPRLSAAPLTALPLPAPTLSRIANTTLDTADPSRSTSRAMAQRRLPLPLVAPLVLALLLLLLPHGSLACTSILVGSNATTDGSIYLSRTVDYSDTATAANNLVRSNVARWLRRNRRLL